jgi:hypothetical protein
MTQDEIIEMAIQGHAGTRDAIRWAIKQALAAPAHRPDEFKCPVCYDRAAPVQEPFFKFRECEDSQANVTTPPAAQRTSNNTQKGYEHTQKENT